VPGLSLVLLLWLAPQAPVPVPAPQTPPTIAAAQALLSSGDAAGARALLEKVVEGAPADTRAWTMLGNLCPDRG